MPDLLRLAQVVCAATGRLYADAGYDSADNRWLCLRDGIRPRIRRKGEPHGSGLGWVRSVVEHGCAWLLADKRLDRRHDRLGRIILALLVAACIFIIANRHLAFYRGSSAGSLRRPLAVPLDQGLSAATTTAGIMSSTVPSRA
ncbi:hypothetical protein [Arenibaculum pallidiluteum]|uniref:hypothetical protein n=1 Tax=Arenibaculum pallidiluteum TaxID=2812559 RepID=UPI0038B3F10D